ncbi:MAG TPA: sugar ABC transporter substrate-binding protein [Nordella sp.]|nr:sugar ABC transporter substrate-binding protein [Nordella sp.]
MVTKLPRAVTRRNLMKLSGAAVAVSGLAGLGLPALASEKKRIAIAHPDRAADYYQGFMNAALRQAEKRGYEVLQSFSGMDPQKQLAEVNTWLASGIDALVVLALDANAMAPTVAKVHEQKALFISYANRIEGEDGFIKWADRDAGGLLGAYAAQHIKEKLGGKGEVGFLTATNIQVVTDRIESTREAILKELPDTKFFEATALNAPDGLKATQSLLQAHPEMKVIICCTDDGALGARSAYQNSGLASDNLLIAGFDGAKQNLNLIKARDPYLQVSMALDIGDIGRRVIDIPYQLWNKGPESETHVLQQYKLVSHETAPADIDVILSVYS